VINAIYTQTQRYNGMPASARVRTAWTPALSMTTGEAVLGMGAGAGVQGTVASKHRVFLVDGTFPGTSVWSPPPE
jgi:hypothetical protein